MFILFFLSISLSKFVVAKDVVIGFGKNKSPFVIKETGQGLEIDIFREALAYKGHTLSVTHINNKGLLNSLILGHVDGVATARDSQQRFCEVDKFIEFDNVIVSLKSRNLDVKKVRDLTAHTLIAWGKAYQDLGAEFNSLYKPNSDGNFPNGYFEHHNQGSQNTMFWAGKSDLMAVDMTIFSWYKKQLSSRFDTDQAIKIHRIFGDKTYFPALFRDQILCEDFRAGLANLKKEKRYQQLFKSYTN